MELIRHRLPGLVELRPRVVEDSRGRFVKTFAASAFEAAGLHSRWLEQFHSDSRAGVLRGLHFQRPPVDHAKLVWCVRGRVLDAALDLRVGSPGYGDHALVELSAERGNALYLPAGFAHGFLAITDATVAYLVDSEHLPTHDAGIRWDSAGIDWPIDAPLVSERDRALPPLTSFESPFRWGLP